MPFRKTTTASPTTQKARSSKPSLGSNYYNYRHDTPQDDRWINRGPIGENGGVNLYTFVHNIPILETDYFGLYTTSLHTAIPAWIAEGYTMAEIAALIGLSLAEIEALVKPQPPKGDFCKALEKAVQKAKKEASKLGNCKDVTLSCDDILERIAVWEELLNARNFLHKKCFDGGGDGHQRQTKQHKETLDKCLENYRKKCNNLACHEQK